MNTLLTAGLAIGLVMEPAQTTEILPVSPDVVAMVAQGCRPDSAFGLKMNEPYRGERMRQLGATAAPFVSMEVVATSRSKTLVGVDLWGYSADDAGTSEQRRAAAADLLEILDVAVEEAGLFAVREWDEEGETIVYSEPVDAPASKLRLELTRMGVSVIVGCADEARRRLALDEALGRTRVERPVKPSLPEPAAPDPTDCDDPVRAEAAYDRFEAGGGHDLTNFIRASSEYFEHLTQWYGQELVDRGVWTEAQRNAFLLSFLEDPVISRGFREQMARLEPLLETTVEVAERRDAGDAVGACQAAIRLTDLISTIGSANDVQWGRVTALYRAEAARLGVTLEE